MVQSHAIPSDITTVVYLRGERVFLRSRAALEICRDLSGLYPLLYIFIIVPGPLRDVIYNYIARHRYRWFGKMDACWMPTPELSDRFFN